MADLKKYMIKAGGSDVFAISLVEEPAVESNFVALAKDKPKYVQLEKNEKRMLYGVILRADFPIYRYDSGMGEYYIEFDSDAIERLERKFMKNYAQKNWTTDHMGYVEGLTLTESWIVTDLEHDKSKALGLEGVTVGSWVGGCLVDDNELWAQVKDGDFKGFSVEAFVEMEELQEEINKFSKINSNMTDNNKLDEVLNGIQELLSIMKPAEETTVEEPVTEEVQLEEEPPAATEPAQEETTVEEPVTEEVQLEEETPAETTVEETVEEAVDNELQQRLEQMQSQLDALRTENEELKGKVEKMGKMPSTKPNSVQGGEQKFSAIEQLDRMGFIKW